jgi:hypothetical protein
MVDLTPEHTCVGGFRDRFPADIGRVLAGAVGGGLKHK